MNVLIVGGGSVGKLLVRALENHAHVVVVEKQREVSDKLAELFSVDVVNINALDVDEMGKLNLKDFELAFVTTRDTSTNILVSLLLKGEGVKRVLCRVKGKGYEEVLERIGVEPLLEAQVVAKELLEKAFHPTIHRLLNSGELGLEEVEGSKWAGKTVGELLEEGYIVVAVEREGQFLYPDRDLVVEKEDTLVVVKR